MKAKKCECGNMMDYNSHYHCYECGCGNTYNAVGQKLLPREQWQEEYDNADNY